MQQQRMIDALEHLELDIQQLARSRARYVEAFRDVSRTSGRQASELELIATRRLDTQLACRLRAVLEPVLTAQTDGSAAGPDWADAIIRNVGRLVAPPPADAA